MPQQVPDPGRKQRKWKPKGYMRGFGRWVGRHQDTKRLAKRARRREERERLKP